MTFTFSGDLANIAIPPILTSGSAKDIAKSKKKNTAAVAKQKAREKLQQTAQAHAVALLNAAESKLKLPNGMHIQAVNDFHSSKDPERHVTIQFTAPICAGTCVGHAYETLGHGKIFDAHHATIFSVCLHHTFGVTVRLTGPLPGSVVLDTTNEKLAPIYYHM